MKILLIKKKFILDIIFIISLLLVGSTAFYFQYSKFKSLPTVYPVNFSKDTEYDLTGDGFKDSFKLISNENKVDFNVKTSLSEFYLSKELDDKILFTKNLHWTPKTFIHDLSRNNIPEIILIGPKNNKSTYYVFAWDNNKFNLITTGNNNILGILDCKNSRTPQCFSLSSSSASNSINSFMVINNKFLNTTNNNTPVTIPSVDTVLNFINLIELPYDLDELPNIFSTNISRDELSIFWALDKDNYSYAFQNAFFYDYDWNEYEEPTAIQWILSFEKNKLNGQDGDKEEMCVFLDIIKDHPSYKITTIQKSK
ncbi:hypothetical protein [uncultured Clostridium sp.]|uniref:hypothetical protein n=1 Tax=uncultured Clostridium sp. TaxID=59620 RepID=UPI0025D128E3|nr:hypothetical protein [uncultured Clostridium sp.]